MPDLLTHTVSAVLIHRLFRKNNLYTQAEACDYHYNFLLFFLIGNILPDIVSRVPMIIMPEWTPFFEPYHTILGSALWVYFFILFFRKEIADKAFLPLFLGTLLHFFLDSFQKNIFGAGYRLFYPLEVEFGFGLVWPEDSIYALPFLIILFFLLKFREFEIFQSGPASQ